MILDYTQVSPWLYVVAPAVIVAAYVVFGLSGFGSTVVSVPILAHFLPVWYLVPLMALLDLFSSALIGTKHREEVAKPELKRLVPFMFVGFVVGVTLLVGVPDRLLRIALGAFAALVGVHGILNPTLRRKIPAYWSVPAGIVGGAAATVFGAGGPVYATYLNGRLTDKGAIRSTISAIISISAFSRTVIYGVSGLLLNVAMLGGAALLAPFAWIGLTIGNRIHIGLTQAQMRRAVGAVLVLTGLSLLVRALL